MFRGEDQVPAEADELSGGGHAVSGGEYEVSSVEDALSRRGHEVPAQTDSVYGRRGDAMSVGRDTVPAQADDVWYHRRDVVSAAGDPVPGPAKVSGQPKATELGAPHDGDIPNNHGDPGQTCGHEGARPLNRNRKDRPPLIFR